MALAIACAVAIICLLWTIRHRPKKEDMEDQAKLKEFVVRDIRANSQYCSWYITLLGVISAIVAAHQSDFHLIFNRRDLWPFGFAFLAASIATLFFPAGYGHSSFDNLRKIWLRSVMCEQIVVILTCYGIWNAFVVLTSHS